MKIPCSIIIPCHNEAACIRTTLRELRAFLGDEVPIAVGLNGCSDESGELARSEGALTGETKEVGYGHGCLVAIEALQSDGIESDSYIFVAADGANRPEDVQRLIRHFEKHRDERFLLGLREFQLSSWVREFGRALPNLLLGIWCRFLGGQFFHDLGPLRLIERNLFEELAPGELTWGWTIEAQIRAAQLGERITSLPVIERERRAGEQKVSGVSLRRSLRIGLAIAAAGWRTRRNEKRPPNRGAPTGSRESGTGISES